MLEVVTETPGVVVANVPVIVSMLGRGVGVLRFLPLALSALSDGGHRSAFFRVDGYLNIPAWRVPGNRRSSRRASDRRVLHTERICPEEWQCRKWLCLLKNSLGSVPGVIDAVPAGAMISGLAQLGDGR